MRAFLTVLLFVSMGLGGSDLLAQQGVSVTIGVDGLHCSACSFSVEKSINRLDFVEYVKMDLNERKAEVVLKKEVDIDFRKLAKAVKNAGFSVRDFYLNLPKEMAAQADCQTWFSDSKICLNESVVGSNTSKMIQLLGKPFLSKSAYKLWKKNNAAAKCSNCEQEDNLYFAVIK